MNMKPRPTTYKGIQMRSRLEAAYAQSLDNRQPQPPVWDYEPECFADETGQYLPDFALHGGYQYVEVKPANADFDAALKRMHVIRSTHPNAGLSVVTKYDEFGQFRTVAQCWIYQKCDFCRPPRMIDMINNEHAPYGDHDGITCINCGEMTLHARLAELRCEDQNGINSGAVIELECECCDTVTTLSFQNRKGSAYIALSSREEPQAEVT